MLNKMKKIIVSFIVILLNISLFSVCVNAQHDELLSTYTFSELMMSSVNSLDVSTINGSITVNGSASSQAVVEVHVSQTGSTNRRNAQTETQEDVKQRIEAAYDIEVKVVDQKLVVTAKPKHTLVLLGRIRDNYTISFKITVPERINTSLSTTNGNIQMDNLTGKQTFKTVNGSVQLSNISEKVSGSTVNGRLSITNSRSDINMSAVNGNISATNSNGIITMSTVNGGITLENCEGEFNLSTVNGRIRQ
jgi:DUF4097 and DUF4098 domain-containing protein YvlB